MPVIEHKGRQFSLSLSLPDNSIVSIHRVLEGLPIPWNKSEIPTKSYSFLPATLCCWIRSFLQVEPLLIIHKSTERSDDKEVVRCQTAELMYCTILNYGGNHKLPPSVFGGALVVFWIVNSSDAALQCRLFPSVQTCDVMNTYTKKVAFASLYCNDTLSFLLILVHLKISLANLIFFLKLLYYKMV